MISALAELQWPPDQVFPLDATWAPALAFFVRRASQRDDGSAAGGGNKGGFGRRGMHSVSLALFYAVFFVWVLNLQSKVDIIYLLGRH